MEQEYITILATVSIVINAMLIAFITIEHSERKKSSNELITNIKFGGIR